MSLPTVIALLLIIAAVITCIPYPRALKRSIIGYRAICPFAPISTSLLGVLAFVVWLVGNLA